MTLAILVAPDGEYIEPLALMEEPSPWAGIDMTWTGANGLSFDLKYRSGVCMVMEAVKGLLNPPIELRTTATPARGGSRLRDTAIGEREVFWPMLVYSNSGSVAWQELNEKFFSSLSADAPGTWTVTRPDGSQRSLKVYFKDDGGDFTLRPTWDGWVRYPITGVALDPYWYGEQLYRRFKQTAASGSLPGPGLPLAASATIQSAVMDNPGNVEGYPVWKVSGPCTAASLGVEINGTVRSIGVPITLTEGQWITIDTDTHQVRDQAGTSRRKDLAASSYFVPIPAGASVPLTMTMTGTGLVECFLTPRYLRAI